MVDKLTDLRGLIAGHVRDGDTIFVGGFGQNIPFAACHEILRQKRRNLTLCRTGADIVFDQMIAAGAVAKVIVGWIGNPGIGIAHAFRRALAAGTVACEETSNFGLLLRLHAASLGVPFLPTRTLLAGDVPAHDPAAGAVTCPFTGERLAAVAALAPDLAIVHAQRGDASGNLQMDGLLGDTVDGANAARRVIATVERVVSESDLREAPDRTRVPGWRVAALAEVPLGAHPSYSHGLYDRDDAAYFEFESLSRDEATLAVWLEAHVLGVASHAGYLDRVGRERIAALVARGGRRG